LAETTTAKFNYSSRRKIKKANGFFPVAFRVLKSRI